MRQRFPTWWQGLIILVSGIVVGFSSCAAFLNQVDFGGVRRTIPQLQPLFAMGFLAGVAVAFAGFVLFIIGVARSVVNALRAPEPTPIFKSNATTMAGSAPVPGVAPGAAGTSPLAAPPAIASREQSDEQGILRNFQIVLVVFMLVLLASTAVSMLALLSRPSLLPTVSLVLVAYVLSQLPYGFALSRTRRGPDRLGIAIAFAAGCVTAAEGLLPFLRLSGVSGARAGLFAWPQILSISHVIVAIFAWRAGKLAPAEERDGVLVAGCFAGVLIYMFVIWYLELTIMPLLLRGLR
jgi:zinc transporter ZupT